MKIYFLILLPSLSHRSAWIWCCGDWPVVAWMVDWQWWVYGFGCCVCGGLLVWALRVGMGGVCVCVCGGWCGLWCWDRCVVLRSCGILTPRDVYVSGFFKKSTTPCNILELRFGSFKIHWVIDPTKSTGSTLTLEVGGRKRKVQQSKK